VPCLLLVPLVLVLALAPAAAGAWLVLASACFSTEQ
jgi:hypothetical protein